jgi:hypothetical protein
MDPTFRHPVDPQVPKLYVKLRTRNLFNCDFSTAAARKMYIHSETSSKDRMRR